MSTNETLRVAFIGWGAIARTAARLLQDAPVDVVAVAVRDTSSPRPDVPPLARLITHPEELFSVKPDVVAEAASRESVGPWGRAALTSGADFIVSSVSAFADTDLFESLRHLASNNSAQLHIPPGALAGVDALAAARVMGLEAVDHRIVKPPLAWQGTPAETLCDLDSLTVPEVFFCASAAETATLFPKSANVAMTTALAGIGPDNTKITLVADPSATTNRHEIEARGAFGQLDITISNNVLSENPKTSAMAALSLVRSIENLVTPIVI